MAENKHALDEVPSKDIQNAIVKLWELIRNAGDKLEESEKNISFLTGQNAEFEASIRRRDAEFSEVRSKFAVLQEDVETLRARNEDLNYALANNTQGLAELEETKLAFAELEKEKAALEQKIILLKEKAALVPILNQEVDELRKSGRDTEEQIDKLNEEVDRLTRIAADFTHAQREIARRNLDLNDKAGVILKLKEELAASQSVIFNLRTVEKDRNESISIIENLYADIKARDEEISTNVTKFDAYRHALAEEKAKLENEILACRHIISEHESSISELFGKAMKSKDDFDEIALLNKELELKIETLAKELNEKNDKIYALLEKQSILVKENEELFTSLDAANNTIVELNKEKDSLITKLDEVKVILEESAKSLEESESKNKELSELFDESEKINKELETSIAEKSASLKLAQDQMLNDSTRILELEAGINALEAKLNILKNDNGELSEKAEQVVDLQSKLDELQPLFADLEIKAQELNKSLEIKSAELSEKVAELTKVQYENEDLLTQNLELEAKLESEAAIAAKALEYEKEKNSLALANSDLQSKLDELVELASKLDSISHENVDLKASIDEYGVNLANANDVIARSEAREKENLEALEELKSDNERLFVELDVLTKEKGALSDRIQEIQTHGDSTLSETLRELEEARIANTELSKLLDELKLNFENATKEYNDKAGLLSGELESKTIAYDAIKLEMSSLNIQFEQKDEDFANLTKAKADSEAMVDEFQKELEAKTDEAKALAEELAKYQSEQSVQAAIFENMKAENAELARKSSEFEIERNKEAKAKADAEAMAEEFQKELEAKAEEAKTLAEELAKYQLEQSVQAAIFENMKAENAALARKSSEFEIERNDEAKAKADAEAMIEEFQKELETKAEEAKALAEELAKYQSEQSVQAAIFENMKAENAALARKSSEFEIERNEEAKAKADAEAMLEEYQLELDSKTETIKTLTSDLDSLKIDKGIIELKANELANSLQTESKAKADAEAMLEEFQKELETKAEEAKALVEELAKYQSEQAVQAAIFENMKAENAALARKSSEFEIERNEEAKAKTDAEAMIEEYQLELDSKTETIKVLTSDLDSLKIDIESIELKANELANSLQTESKAKSDAEAMLEEYQLELDSKTETIKELTTDLDSLKIDKDNIELKANELASSLETEAKAKADAEAKIEELNLEIEAKLSEIKNIHNNLNQIKSEKSELQNNVNELEDTINSIRKELYAEKERNLNVGIEKSGHESQIIEMQAHVNSLTSLLASKDAKMAESDTISKENARRKDEIEMLKAENANLSKEIETVKFANEKAEAEKVARLEYMVQELSNDKSTKESRMNSLQTKIEGLEDLLQTRFDHIKLLEKEVDELARKRSAEKKERQAVADKLEKVVSKLENYSLF